MEKLKDAIASLREVAVLCLLTVKWQEKGKITKDEAYLVSKKGMVKSEEILKVLAEERTI